MTELEQQIREVDGEVDLLMASDETRLAIDEISLAEDILASALEELASVSATRKAMLESGKDFDLSDIELSESSIWRNIASSYDSVQSIWETNRTKVRQEAAFQEMVQSLEALATSMQKNNKDKWREWVTAQATGFAVSTAELESIKHVPEYKANIAKFKAKVLEFTQLENRLPSEVASISKLKTLSAQLRELKSGFNFALPDNALNFFKELDENGTFPLNKIDVELMRWLADNNELQNLSVTRRRSGGYL